MKIGDLVTLSRYGLNLGSIPWKYRRYNKAAPLIGVVTGVAEIDDRSYLSKNEVLRYVVRWNDAPDLKGREWYREYFFRNDLKYLK